MKNKFFLFIALIFMLFNYGYTIKLHTFADLHSPRQFSVDNDYIYVADHRNPNNKVYIFNRENFKLVKALLKRGEGPQEIIYPPTVTPVKDKIYVFSGNKVIMYSKKFEYMDEIKLNNSDSRIVPVKDNFIVLHPEDKGKILYEIYSLYKIENKKFKKIKDLVKIPIDIEEVQRYIIVFFSQVAGWKDRAFISTRDKLNIQVYDEQGNNLYTIDGKLDPIKGKEIYRQRELEEVLVHFGPRLYNATIKDRLEKKELPAVLPDIKNLSIGHNRLFIQTYDTKGKKDKYLIFDFKGKLIKTIWLPKTFGNKKYFYDNKFYYFCEAEDEEGWELHMTDLQ